MSPLAPINSVEWKASRRRPNNIIYCANKTMDTSEKEWRDDGKSISSVIQRGRGRQFLERLRKHVYRWGKIERETNENGKFLMHLEKTLKAVTSQTLLRMTISYHVDNYIRHTRILLCTRNKNPQLRNQVHKVNLIICPRNEER